MECAKISLPQQQSNQRLNKESSCTNLVSSTTIVSVQQHTPSCKQNEFSQKMTHEIGLYNQTPLESTKETLQGLGLHRS